MSGRLEQLGPDAQKKCIELNVSGMSHQAVADELNKEYNADLTFSDVKNYISRNRNKSAQLLKENKSFQSQLVKQYFDTVDQLKQLNAEMWKFFYEIRQNPEYKDKIIVCPKCKNSLKIQMQSYGLLLKTADTLLSQIRHVDTVLGKMQKKQLNITYNYVDLTKKIGIVMPQLLGSMEKKGLISVKKKRLKEYYSDKKMDYIDEEEEEEEEEIEA